jgi:hypothetical protein
MIHVKCFEAAKMPADIAELLCTGERDTFPFYVCCDEPRDSKSKHVQLYWKAIDWLVSNGASPGEKVIIERGHWPNAPEVWDAIDDDNYTPYICGYIGANSVISTNHNDPLNIVLRNHNDHSLLYKLLIKRD